ncbi:hypothetical protein ACWD69_22680 [Micromonospora chokoriensis]
MTISPSDAGIAYGQGDEGCDWRDQSEINPKLSDRVLTCRDHGGLSCAVPHVVRRPLWLQRGVRAGRADLRTDHGGGDLGGVQHGFYVDRGLTVAKSFGRKYVEFATSNIKLALYGRRAAAKDAGVSPDGAGSHRLVIGSSSAGTFTDPDGFEWKAGE